MRPARRYSPEVARSQRSWCGPPGPLDQAIPQQVRPFARHPQLDSPALVPSKSVIAMALVALHRTAPSALVSRPIFGTTATASDNRAGHAGMAPRSPDNATSLPRCWLRATTDKPSREASAGTRQHRTSLVDSQFLDLARIRRYTACSGERLLLNSSEHGARPTIAPASFLLRSYPVGAVAYVSWTHRHIRRQPVHQATNPDAFISGPLLPSRGGSILESA